MTQVSDLDPDRTVYRYGVGSEAVHTDPQCHVTKTGREPKERRAGSLNPDMPVCSYCTGEYEPGANEGGHNPGIDALARADPDDPDWEAIAGAAREGTDG